MYRRILVALDASPSDESLLAHVEKLAGTMKAELILLHVADGWAARHFGSTLQPVESEEMAADRAYLEKAAAKLAEAGLQVTTQLALGNPPTEILRAAGKTQCDLIAMATHGHRWLADLFFGSTITTVRHRAQAPVLLVRAERI